MNSRLSTEQKLSASIKAEARRLGFFACGVAEAAAVGGEAARAYSEWLRRGCNADMDYMANHADLRLDPRLLLPGARSVVSVALAYAPARRMPDGEFQLSAYAYGRDYHDAVKSRLRLLAAHIERVATELGALPEADDGQPAQATRVCCDTAPILERHWAWRAGLGWTGRNHQLIIPGAGSQFFLGEVLTTITIAPDAPMENRCGDCRACLDACPTHALTASGLLDARLCLSYLTIENRGPIPPRLAAAMGNCIYGCDRCQAACPHNAAAPTATAPELQPSAELLAMHKADWRTLTPEKYRSLFKGSAVKRAKYEGLMRNIRAAEAAPAYTSPAAGGTVSNNNHKA